MSKFDDRVRRLVAEEMSDVRALFLDKERDASPASPQERSIRIGYGHEGVKAEIVHIEQMLSELYTKAKKEESEEEEEKRDNAEANDVIKELVVNDGTTDDGQGLLNKVLKFIDDAGITLNFNAPFANAPDLKPEDYAITQAIKAAPLPPWMKAVALLTFGVGRKLRKGVDATIKDIIDFEELKGYYRVQRELNELLLKLENEVNSVRADFQKRQDGGRESTFIPSALGDLVSKSQLTVYNSEVIRGLL